MDTESYQTDPFLITTLRELENIKKNNKPVKIIVYNPYSKDSKTKVQYAEDIQKNIKSLEWKIYKHIKKYYPEKLIDK